MMKISTERSYTSSFFFPSLFWIVSKIVEIGELLPHNAVCRVTLCKAFHSKKVIEFRRTRHLYCFAVATTMITIVRSSLYIQVLASVPCSMFNRPCYFTLVISYFFFLYTLFLFNIISYVKFL